MWIHNNHCTNEALQVRKRQPSAAAEIKMISSCELSIRNIVRFLHSWPLCHCTLRVYELVQRHGLSNSIKCQKIHTATTKQGDETVFGLPEFPVTVANATVRGPALQSCGANEVWASGDISLGQNYCQEIPAIDSNNAATHATQRHTAAPSTWVLREVPLRRHHRLPLHLNEM